MSEPLVSVIIPLYNRKHLISRCVKSVCKQTYTNLEIIVVDDGSTDKPDEVLAELAKDTRVKILRKPNGGVSSARNMGLDAATGKYIQFVDSDDMLRASAIQDCVEISEKEQAEEVVFRYDSQLQATVQNEEYRVIEGEQCVTAIMQQGLLCVPFNKLFRHEKINKLRFPVGVSWGEDFIFNLAYSTECKKIILLQKSLYYLDNQDTNSLNHRYDPQGFDDAKAQIAAVNAYLATPRELSTQIILKFYLWMCYLECARKVCDRSRLPFREKMRLLRQWSQDEDIVALAPYAQKYPMECFCLAKNWLFLFLFAYALRRKLTFLKKIFCR